MCLLLIAYNKFPSKEILELGEKQNSDGAGIAWASGGKVHWIKGLKARDLPAYAMDTKGPWLIHFRKASIGGARPDLCHPFPTDGECSTATTGDTLYGVLAHNGTWHKWHEELINLINLGHEIPTGPWSDTRTMAWGATVVGEQFLIDAQEKIAWMTSDGEITRYGSGWYEDKDTGIDFSYNPYTKATYTHSAAEARRKLVLTAEEYGSYEEFFENSIAGDARMLKKYNEWKNRGKKSVWENPSTLPVHVPNTSLSAGGPHARFNPKNRYHDHDY